MLTLLRIQRATILLFLSALVVLVGVRFYRGSPRLVSVGKINSDSFKCLIPSDTLGYAFRSNCETKFKREDGRVIQIKYNSKGFRDRDYSRKTRRRHRVLIVGDSQMVAVGLPEANVFPRLLEAAWRKRGYDIEVINGAVLGASLIRIYIMLPGLIEAYQPDKIILVDAISGNASAKLFQQGHFLDVNRFTGRPQRIRNMKFNDNLIDVPGIFEWGPNEIQRMANRRTFLELAGNFRRSWKCVLGFLGDEVDCVLGDYFYLLKIIRDRSLGSGAKFLFLTYGSDYENFVQKGAWDLPWFLRMMAWLTPKVMVSNETLAAYLDREDVPALVLDQATLFSRGWRLSSDDGAHFSEDVHKELSERYGDEIAKALSISK